MNPWLKKISLFVSLALALLPAYGQGANVYIAIEPVFNGAPLKLADQRYVTPHGDTVFIDLFRFYITNATLNNEATTLKDGESHLVDAEIPSSLMFPIGTVNGGVFNSLRFVAGVDSATNTNGANGGDLDPAKGMYWAWNSGYIMAKLEGRSKVCKTLHHAFQFHIGGYMPPYDAARKIAVVPSSPITVKSGVKTIIHIRADAAAWFGDGLDLASTNEIMIPGKAARMMADKYARMFTITGVTYE